VVLALVAAPAAEAASARDALERARALFAGDGGRAERGEATIVLRDLRAALPRLTGSARAEAERLLARPTDGPADPFGHGYLVPSVSSCTAHTCVHWVESTADAPSPADANVNGIPDWVETTQLVLEQVWASEVGTLGYNAPRDDSASFNHGPDGRLDVYLKDIGDLGLFGYCSTDDPSAFSNLQVSAFCVLENDYAESGFAPLLPLDALQVTAAHELFHAIQFAYDWNEDVWLLEGTAAWMEDEIYDAIDDNRGYLKTSPLAHPEVPLDHGARGYEYGSWIFWRYLSERFGASIVHDVIGRAATANSYSLAALIDALSARGLRFRPTFASFAVANRLPHRWYSEGADYPSAPTSTTYTVTPRAPRTTWRRERLSHLSSRYVSYRSSRGVTRRAKLRISVAAPASDPSQAASAIVLLSSGAVSVRRIPIGPAGNGSLLVPFGRGVVRRVDVVLVNAGTTFACWRGTELSCRGVSLDDALAFRVRGTLSR
jgi:hypothetical protein